MVRKATAQDVADLAGQDVAHLAGVSRSAVSLVLNGRAQGHIARDKQQAIIDAARELNYTPNAVAVSLRNRRTRTIGVLTWSSPSGFSVPMLHATLKTATAAGYLPIFMDTRELDDGEQLASQLVPQLTTIKRPNRAMAEQAVTVTLQAVDEDNGGEIRQLTLNCSPAIRDSVARPRPPNRRPCRPADRS